MRKRNDRWYIGWRDEDGLWQDEVTRALTKTEAKLLAEKKECQAELVRRGLAAPAPKAMTFNELADRYLAVANTVKNRRPWLASRLNHLRPKLGNKLLSRITAEDIESLLVEKADEFSECTLEHMRCQLRAMFNVATRWKLFAGQNPASKVPKRDVQRRQTQYLEAHEIPVLLDAVPERWRGVFAVGIYAGLRKGEIAGLRWTDIDLGRRVITVARSYNRPTKTKRIRQVEICDELLAFLEEEPLRFHDTRSTFGTHPPRAHRGHRPRPEAAGTLPAHDHGRDLLRRPRVATPWRR